MLMKRTWLRIIALILVAFVGLAGNYHQDTLDVIGCLKEAIEVSKDAPDRGKLQIQTRKKNSGFCSSLSTQQICF